VAIGIGVNPWYGTLDPERMGEAVVDEAIRNAVAVGADPDHVALLDNFSWGDPRRPATLGDLVAAVEGICRAALAHRAPFVSGKDSLNNEYVGRDGERHAVPPTLVITAVGVLPDAARAVTPDLKEPGNVLVLLGATQGVLGGSRLAGAPSTGVVPAHDPVAPARYRALFGAINNGLVRSCHDVGYGGVAVALAEMVIGGRLGARVQLPAGDRAAVAFGEACGRFVVEVAPSDLDTFTAAVGAHTVLGRVTDDGALYIDDTIALDRRRLTTAFFGVAR
jgi:phosphoribosylformylglycinamidine synthase